MNYDSSGIFSKVLSGVSKSLGIASQLIPLYQDSEPIIKNARTLYNIVKNKNHSPEKVEAVQELKESVPEKKSSSNSPQFFI